MSRDVLRHSPRIRRALFQAKLAIARILPMHCGRLLAYAMGTLLWSLDPAGRAVVRRNLRHFLPHGCEDALARMVRRNYIYFCLYLYEMFRLDRLGANFFCAPALSVIDPWRVLGGKPIVSPAILVTVHSHWELVPAVLHRLGAFSSVDVVALESGDPAIDALFAQVRASVGVRSLDLQRAPLRSLRTLKDGGLLGLVADRDYSGTGLFVPFAGELMQLPTGPAALSVQTQSPIIPFFLARRGLSQFVLVVGKPLIANTCLAKRDQVTDLTRRLAATMVRFIAAAPSQWIAFHDAWPRQS